MRRQDLEHLEMPYDEALDELETRLPRRLGVLVPGVWVLHDEILSDLDPETFGIRWWAAHLDAKRRILIGDYLLQAVYSIQTNLTEAKLHLLEARDAWERENRRHADTTWRDAQGNLCHDLPPIDSPLDELPGVLAMMHTAGLLRALGSALDCLGGVIVGVGALSTGILRTDLKAARRELKRVVGEEPGPARQIELRERLEELVETSGPTGWLDWITDYRNMLVHRGRRPSFSHLDPRHAGFVDDRELPVVRVSVIPVLHVDPGRSEIEVMVHHDQRQFLEEDARVTLRGALESVLQFARNACDELVALWRQRRADPALLPQPERQWPRVVAPRETFEGYDPGSVPFRADQAKRSASALRRLQSAAVSVEDRPKWDDWFDE